jgi:hypothetical protein
LTDIRTIGLGKNILPFLGTSFLPLTIDEFLRISSRNIADFPGELEEEILPVIRISF